MPLMFVANASKQVQDFQFRTAKGQGIKIPIEPGGQVRVPGDLTVADIEAIVRHHAKFGMRAVSELARSNEIVPLIFTTERPMARTIIASQVVRNQALMEGRGHELRKAAGIFIHKQLEQGAAEADTKLHEVEVSVEELDTKDVKARDDHTEVNEILRITRHEEPQERSAKPQPRRPRAGARSGPKKKK